MAMTDREIRKIRPGKTLTKLSDGGGLQLWVMPDGAKRWRLAYRHNGKQKTLAIGVYPTTRLREARNARDDAKRLLSSGQDPSLVRKRAKAAKAKASANTFNSLADELLEKKLLLSLARHLRQGGMSDLPFLPTVQLGREDLGRME
jgi:hypothetical protein